MVATRAAGNGARGGFKRRVHTEACGHERRTARDEVVQGDREAAGERAKVSSGRQVSVRAEAGTHPRVPRSGATAHRCALLRTGCVALQLASTSLGAAAAADAA